MIHQYKLGEYNIVLDVCSGSVHCVDDVAYDVIEMFESSTRDEIASQLSKKYADNGVSSDEVYSCYDEICELKDSGKLFSPDSFEPMASTLKEKTAGVIKALC